MSPLLSKHLLSPVDACRVEPAGSGVGPDGPAGVVPLYLDAVSAGFPSPAEDYVETALDLNRYLVTHPAATFMVRVGGDSMIDAGILDGDVLVVDRSRDPLPGRIVVAVLDGELTVKRLCRSGKRLILVPENTAYPPIELREDQELIVWGVVTGVVRRL